MYVPFRKIYRAFGELKNLSDEECEKHLRRVRLKHTKWHFVPPAAGVAGAGAALVALWLMARFGLLDGFGLDPRVSLVVVYVLAVTVLAGLTAGLVTRDLVLLHLLRGEIHKARCPKCGQSLLGLPITFRGLGPPEPGDGKVRCPECGRQWVLLDIGLRPTDLVPWEMRGVPADYGKVKKQGTWAGR